MLVKGFILGLALSAPIGVIGTWCIQRSIQYGFRYGLATGLGAVAADLIFAILAALGFTKLIEPWLEDNPWLTLLGASIIIYMGARILLNANPSKQDKQNNKPSLLSSFIGSFLLIMTHPAAIFIFIGIFSGVGINLYGNTPWTDISLLLMGILLGSICWWSFLSALSAQLGKKMTPSIMIKFNYASGFIIIVFGLWLSLSLFYH